MVLGKPVVLCLFVALSPACSSTMGTAVREPPRPFALGPTAWDGVQLELDAPYWSDWVGVDSGAAILIHEDGHEFQIREHAFCESRWIAEDELYRGSYSSLELRGIINAPLGSVDYDWQFAEEELSVGAWGLSTGFTPEEISGAVFELDYGNMNSCGGLIELIDEILYPSRMFIQIIDATEDQVRFRWVQELGYDEHEVNGCVYLEDNASLDPTGKLLWDRGELQLSTEPALGAYQSTLQMAFDPWGNSIAGVELSTTIDFAGQGFGSTSDSGDTGGGSGTEEPLWKGYCEFLEEAYGRPCHTCGSGELESCLEVTYFAGQAERIELGLDSDTFPSCEVALVELPEFPGCDGGCSSTAGKRTSITAFLLLLLTLCSRRRPSPDR